MILDLQDAIMTRFNSTDGATLRGLVQGLWEDLAPASVISDSQKGEELRNSVLPWMTFTFVTTGLEQSFCSNFFIPIVQFSIFGDADNNTSRPLLEVGDAFLDLYGDQLLTMDNGYTMTRSDTVDQRKFIDENKMWNVIYEIQYHVETDR